MVDYPTRGSRPWDQTLKAYVDSAVLSDAALTSRGLPRNGTELTALVVKQRTALSVAEFGATGDGTDQTAKLVAAHNAAAASGMQVYYPPGDYLAGTLPSAAGSDIIGAGSNTTRIKAKPGTALMLDSKDLSGKRISGLTLDGMGIAQTCVDTSWTGGDGPSLGNTYEDLRLRGFTTLGWKALDNNDCPFNRVLIEPPTPSIPALDVRAAGGAVWFNDSRFFGPMIVSAQILHMSGGSCLGLHFDENAWNVVDIDGTYLFADAATHNIFTIANGVSVQAASVTAHIENKYADGAIFGGPGFLQGFATFTGGDMMGIEGATPRLVSTGLGLGSPRGRVVLDGTWVESVNLASATGAAVIQRSVKKGSTVVYETPVTDSVASADDATLSGFYHWTGTPEGAGNCTLIVVAAPAGWVSQIAMDIRSSRMWRRANRADDVPGWTPWVEK